MQTFRQEEGQTSVEYGLVIATIATVLVMGLTVGLVGPATDFFAGIADRLPF